MTASDPVFLITGASSGIGAATARQAATAGYRVALGARSTERIEALAEELGGPERAIAVTCDVTEWEQQEAFVQTTLERFGQLDVAFANAGFGASRGFTAETPEFWRSMVDTPFFDKGAGEGALKPDDVARVVMFAVSQPPHVDVNEILVRPTAQPN
jgi:NADP-dependent 3-hydroxy acid dehydrogenase YdfG